MGTAGRRKDDRGIYRAVACEPESPAACGLASSVGAARARFQDSGAKILKANSPPSRLGLTADRHAASEFCNGSCGPG